MSVPTRFTSLAYSFVFGMYALTCSAQVRLGPVPVGRQTEAQKKAVAAYKADRKAELNAPYAVLLRSPEMMMRMRALGSYVRFEGVLPARLREVAVLLTARAWTAQFEWTENAQLAVDSGVKAETVKAIAEGRRPVGMAEDEAIVYDLCAELLQNKSVSDVTYNRAVAKLGEQQVVEAVTTVGYYTMIGMVLNTARIPGGAGVPEPLAGLPATR